MDPQDLDNNITNILSQSQFPRGPRGWMNWKYDFYDTDHFPTNLHKYCHIPFLTENQNLPLITKTLGSIQQHSQNVPFWYEGKQESEASYLLITEKPKQSLSKQESETLGSNIRLPDGLRQIN